MMLRQVSLRPGGTDLGDWGALRLTGDESVVAPRQALDVELPGPVAETVTHAGLILNEAQGVLLVLPFQAETVARIELVETDEPYSEFEVPRDEDRGLRVADLRVIDDGVLFLTERSVLRFAVDLRLVWRVDGDFLGWVFEAVEDGRIVLGCSNWSGEEFRQVLSIEDGRRLD
jgi:hypothetical protein